MSIGEERKALRNYGMKFLELSPVKESLLKYYETTYQAGALDAKTKRLIALCGGLVSGCKGCILAQTDLAVQEGACAEEVLETCAVAMSLGGTMAWSQVAMVVEYLEESGLIE